MLPTLVKNPPQLNADLHARHAAAAKMIRDRSAG